MEARVGSGADGPRSGAVRWLGLALCALLALCTLELGARAVFALWDGGGRQWVQARRGGGELDAYQILPAGGGPIRLRPGYVGTLQGVLREKQARGRTLAVAYLQELQQRRSVAPDQVIFRVNRAGLKGPELRAGSPGLRVLHLGDSCTFGSWLDEESYPRVVEHWLREHGLPVEALNGGVEGYRIADVHARLAEWLALRPQVVTLYVGWNDLFSAPGLGWADTHLATPRLLRRLRAAVVGPRTYQRPGRPRLDDPDLDRAARYAPAALGTLRETVRALRGAGVRVVLITLPSLYAEGTAPSAEALRIGHLPAFTDNPLVLARMVAAYNARLRRLAREERVDLVDAAAWADVKFRPRHSFFIDTVHLTGDAQVALGEHLAAALRPIVAERARNSGP